jgi:hypothetical protein
MREIANTTARSAVAYSDLDRKKARGLVQLVIAFGAMIMAGYYLLYVTKSVGDTASIVGLVCLIAAITAGVLGLKCLKTAGVFDKLVSQSKTK